MHRPAAAADLASEEERQAGTDVEGRCLAGRSQDGRQIAVTDKGRRRRPEAGESHDQEQDGNQDLHGGDRGDDRK